MQKLDEALSSNLGIGRKPVKLQEAIQGCVLGRNGPVEGLESEAGPWRSRCGPPENEVSIILPDVQCK